MNHDPEWGELPPELERALAAPPARAPALFTERVMERVRVAGLTAAGPSRATERLAAAAPTPVRGPLRGDLLAPALEWWVRAAADPAVALSLALAGLLLWRADAVVPAFESMVAWLLAAPRSVAPPLHLGAIEHLIPHGVVALAVSLALLPAVLWGSWRFALWLERDCMPRPRAAMPR